MRSPRQHPVLGGKDLPQNAIVRHGQKEGYPNISGDRQNNHAKGELAFALMGFPKAESDS